MPGVALPRSFPLAMAYFSPRCALCLLLAKKFSESSSTRLSDQATLVAALVCLMFLLLHWKCAHFFIEKWVQWCATAYCLHVPPVGRRAQLNQVSLLRRQQTDNLVRCLNEQPSRPLPKLYGGVSMEAVRMTSTLFTAQEEEEMVRRSGAVKVEKRELKPKLFKEEEHTETSDTEEEPEKQAGAVPAATVDAKQSVRLRGSGSSRRAGKVVVEETVSGRPSLPVRVPPALP